MIDGKAVIDNLDEKLISFETKNRMNSMLPFMVDASNTNE